MCTKMLKKVSEKLRAIFPAATRGYSMVKIVRLDDALSQFFELEASPVEGQSLQQLVRQSQIVQSVMYSYDAVISSYINTALHSWFCKSARDFDDETI